MTALIAALTAAQAADAFTRISSPRVEANPLAAALLAEPLAVVAAKAALVALVVAAYLACGRGRLGTAVVALGACVGLVGALSNL